MKQNKTIHFLRNPRSKNPNHESPGKIKKIIVLKSEKSWNWNLSLETRDLGLTTRLSQFIPNAVEYSYPELR